MYGCALDGAAPHFRIGFRTADRNDSSDAGSPSRLGLETLHRKLLRRHIVAAAHHFRTGARANSCVRLGAALRSLTPVLQ